MTTAICAMRSASCALFERIWGRNSPGREKPPEVEGRHRGFAEVTHGSRFRARSAAPDVFLLSSDVRAAYRGLVRDYQHFTARDASYAGQCAHQRLVVVHVPRCKARVRDTASPRPGGINTLAHRTCPARDGAGVRAPPLRACARRSRSSATSPSSSPGWSCIRAVSADADGFCIEALGLSNRSGRRLVPVVRSFIGRTFERSNATVGPNDAKRFERRRFERFETTGTSAQSVLKPHSGQRQTACIRYISALPHRSQISRSSVSRARCGLDGSSFSRASRTSWSAVPSGSAMRRIIGQRFSVACLHRNLTRCRL